MTIHFSNNPDSINEFHILDQDPAFKMHSEFCDYYKTVSSDTMDYLALVFKKFYTPDIKNLERFSTQRLSGINSILTYGVVQLSATKSEYLVAIVAGYDLNNTLDQYVKSNGPLSSEEILDLISSILEVLEFCDHSSMPLGNINPKNIFFKNKKLFLGECVNAYSHFYQDNAFLAPELAECHKAGRYLPSVAADIYALGVTVFYTLTGQTPWSSYSDDFSFNNARFEKGTAELLISKRRIPDFLKVFLRGTMKNMVNNRWKVSDIKKWLQNIDKVSVKPLQISSNEQLTSPLNLAGQDLSTLKSIVHSMFYNWDEAIKTFQDEKITKWVSKNHLNSYISDCISDVSRGVSNFQHMSTTNSDLMKRFSRLLSALDPSSGIMLKGIAFTASSIPYLLQYLLGNNQYAIIEQILNNFPKSILKIAYSKDYGCAIDQDLFDKYSDAISIVNSPELRQLYLEWIIYFLNPDMQCVSPILSSTYVNNVQDLLYAIDHFASTNAKNLQIDNHMIGFIAAHMSLRIENIPKILPKFPKFKNNIFIYSLPIINVAAQKYTDINITNLIFALSEKIIEQFDANLYHIKFKVKIKDQLLEYAQSADLGSMIKLLSNQSPFINDYNGYYAAVMEINQLNNRIDAMRNNDILTHESLILGQKITVLFSYVICLIVTTTLFLA